MDWLSILITAGISATFTIVVIAGWLHFYVSPRVAEDLQELLREQADRAADILAEKVEEGVRRGVIDGVTSLPTREVLQGTTRNIARTSVEIVESRLGHIFGRRRSDRRSRAQKDDNDDQ